MTTRPRPAASFSKNDRSAMKKPVFIAVTLAVMLAVSALTVWLVDAVVQIDGDFGTLIGLLIVVNGLIGLLALRLYKRNR